jgi:hypothetical protein
MTTWWTGSYGRHPVRCSCYQWWGEIRTNFCQDEKSLVTDFHGMKSPAQFPGILTDKIITRGAPTKLISDSALVETSKEVRGILHTYGISCWQSEPHQQHQNPAERQYQTVKQLCNTILDQTGAPAYCWLLCLMYVCFILNNAFSEVIQSTPFRRPTALTMTSALCYTSRSMNWCTTWLMILLSDPKERNFMDYGLVLARM